MYLIGGLACITEVGSDGQQYQHVPALQVTPRRPTNADSTPATAGAAVGRRRPRRAASFSSDGSADESDAGDVSSDEEEFADTIASRGTGGFTPER